MIDLRQAGTENEDCEEVTQEMIDAAREYASRDWIDWEACGNRDEEFFRGVFRSMYEARPRGTPKEPLPY